METQSNIKMNVYFYFINSILILLKLDFIAKLYLIEDVAIAYLIEYDNLIAYS